MPVDTDKLFELLIKYKTQVSYLIGFILCVSCFVGGRLSVDCPPKSEVCKAEISTIQSQFAQLAEKDQRWTTKLRERLDEVEGQCTTRIQEALDQQRATDSIVQCEEVCTLYPQCKRANQCR